MITKRRREVKGVKYEGSAHLFVPRVIALAGPGQDRDGALVQGVGLSVEGLGVEVEG